MFKNRNLSSTIAFAVSIVVIICFFLLFAATQKGFGTVVENTAMDLLTTSLKAKECIIEEYVSHSEAQLISYSSNPCIKEFLKNPNNPKLQKKVQDYTSHYFKRLNQWEGIYLSQWDTTVLAHSNTKAIGHPFRNGDKLKELQIYRF